MLFTRSILPLVILAFLAIPAGSQLQADCDPGFVSAECANEQQRVNNCNPANSRCDDLRKDLESCQAQCVPEVTNGGILPGPANGSEARGYLLGKFLPKLTNSFLIFNMIMAVLVLVIAGMMWVFAPTNEELKKRAQDAIVWTLIGVTIAVLAYLLVQIVININFFA